jgi:hypothetical protein
LPFSSIVSWCMAPESCRRLPGWIRRAHVCTKVRAYQDVFSVLSTYAPSTCKLS